MDIYSTGGTVDANNNWWGSNFTGTNPQFAGRVNSTVTTTTWIVLTITPEFETIPLNGTSTITIDLLHDNTGASVSGVVPYTDEVNITTTLGSTTNSNMSNGIATTTLNAGLLSGIATVTAIIDDTSVIALVNIVL